MSPPNQRAWTTKEIRMLKESAEYGSALRIAKLLNRSHGSVLTRRLRIRQEMRDKT